MNVYNIVWADDEIDDLLDDETVDELKEQGFNIVGMAHNGKELEQLLEKPKMVDAVIVDANFNESDTHISSERDTSGLTYARSIYTHMLKRSIPFFLLTNRADELLREIYQYILISLMSSLVINVGSKSQTWMNIIVCLRKSRKLLMNQNRQIS